MKLLSKQELHQLISKWVKWSQKFTDKSWYAFLVGIFALIDNLIVIIPTDGILISSTMLRPKRWLIFAFAVTFGSSLGALLLAYILEIHGLPWLLQHYPGVTDGWVWATTEKFFTQYGLLIVFAVAAAPIFQQPAIAMAAMANISLELIFITVFAGRFFKYCIMAYISAHAPRLLSKLWGLQDELEEVGIKDLGKAN